MTDEEKPEKVPPGPFDETWYELMWDAARRVIHEYILRLGNEGDGDTDPAFTAIRAIRAEARAVPLDDVPAWKRARDDFDERWRKLRDERKAKEVDDDA